jgi:peptide/nickel transport system permease protein
MSEMRTQDDRATRVGARVRNWPLWIGAAMAGVLLLLAWIGPTIAPKDPREHALIIQVEGKWMKPPYPAFTTGYPLGSDNLGRDLYSWLLWSLRPTMVLVLTVAAIRIVLGIVIGVGAGWSDRPLGRLCDALISGALAVPTLIGALVVITAVGFRLGVWAFVVGLAVTGWAETAQLVRERTRTVRAQDAVEAARALGASGPQILALHILPQVMPMIWMLLAFEISHALVTTAGLGFLGYYLGGAVFTEVDDFVYQRISDMPELGQMLATAWMVLDEPWAMVAAGSVVFLIVLAFNLIGEGLQSRLTRKLGGPRSLYVRLAGELIPWLDRWLVRPTEQVAGRRDVRVSALVLLGLALGGALLWWRLPAPSSNGAQEELIAVVPTPTVQLSATGEPVLETVPAVPGGHLWANEGHDPWHTRWVAYAGPLTSTTAWSLEVAGAFVGGPAIDAGGVLYLAARTAQTADEASQPAGVLYAVDSEGAILWQALLSGSPVGSPALAADGTIYVADK